MTTDFVWVSTTNMLIVNDDKILLIKRNDDAEDFPGWYMPPGGKHEHNETPQQTAIRETFEETGIKVTNPVLRVIATHFHEYKSKVYLVYIFESSEFSGKLIESEEGTPMWVPYQQALKDPKLFPDLRRHLKLIKDTNSTEVIFTYHRFNSKLEIIETL